jgi:hypothetical protein
MTEATRISHTLPKGYQLDDFEIEEVLGIGGFGITYRARDVQLNRTVAIKEYMPSGIAVRDKDAATVFPTSDSHKEDFEWGLDRFRKEAETLVSFRHPNIVSVYRFFRANGTAYLVMEYQDGKSLADILGAGNTLNEAEIDEIIQPLLDGLEQVHEAGFMHRDIKPANIFVRRDGKPVLIDFGAARQALGGHSHALTSIVTAGYAPYEQYETDSVQGPWSDIYALGATLYRAVTGVRPVEAPKRAGAVMRGEPDPNSPASTAAKGKYSATLLAAIDAALNVLEGDRPQSVAAFRACLDGSAASEAATEATAPTGSGAAVEGATLYVGGAAGPSGQTAATAAPSPGGGAGETASSAPTVERPGGPVPPPHEPVQPYKPPRRAWIWVLAGFGALLIIGGAAAAVYVVVRDQRVAEEAARQAEARKLAEQRRKAAEAEAQRKAAAEAKRKAAEEAKRKAAEEAKRKAAEEAKRKAEADRKRREADVARRKDNKKDTDLKPGGPEQANPPDDNNNNNYRTNRPTDPRPDLATVGAPGALLGRWCSARSHITFDARTMAVHNLKTNWTATYHVKRFAITPTVVTIYFIGGDGVGNGVFVFTRQRHSAIRMRLTRAYFGKRWHTYTTYFSRSC